MGRHVFHVPILLVLLSLPAVDAANDSEHAEGKHVLRAYHHRYYYSCGLTSISHIYDFHRDPSEPLRVRQCDPQLGFVAVLPSGGCGDSQDLSGRDGHRAQHQ